ncbi:hypothetical protein TIFTF001_014319 [Ficus carica]|uniref:Uncharacterized protein n=1 Tax=Ficus carica TaxID=3494 RepID=A0AA88A536_FICCA|nr:hypothetical protein TIFTF001_014319 [Ficus carica]
MGVKYEAVKGYDENGGEDGGVIMADPMAMKMVGQGRDGHDLELGLQITAKQERHPLPQQQQRQQNRLVSLDVFRGLTVAVL